MSNDAESSFIVAMRVRPLLGKELDNKCKSVIKVVDEKVVCILDPTKVQEKEDYLRRDRSREKQFAFDHAFDTNTSQDSVYRHAGAPIIMAVLGGYNASVFAYGATGAGKTFTMLGDMQNPGLMVRVVAALFDRMRSDSEHKFNVVMSYLEVYNENIKDLLTPTGQYLELREDSTRGVTVAGITEYAVTSVEQTMELLHRGNTNRSVEPTKRNETSSRSHAVLQIVVEQEAKTANTKKQVVVSKLSLIDLAGSERASATENRGQRLLEGANINRSLLALANCINALATDSKPSKLVKGKKPIAKYVPYRDSKLTRLLKDSFGGNTRTAMIANVSPSHVEFEETVNTLKYANRAKNIKTKLRRNVHDVKYHVAEYKKIIENLRAEIADLKDHHQSVSPQISRSPTHVSEEDAQKQAKAFLDHIMRLLAERQSLLDRLVGAEEKQWDAELGRKSDMSMTGSSVTRARQECAELRSRLAENESKFRQLQSSVQSKVLDHAKRDYVALMVRNRVLALQNSELQNRSEAQSRFINHALEKVAASPSLAPDLAQFVRNEKGALQFGLADVLADAQAGLAADTNLSSARGQQSSPLFKPAAPRQGPARHGQATHSLHDQQGSAPGRPLSAHSSGSNNVIGNNSSHEGSPLKSRLSQSDDAVAVHGIDAVEGTSVRRIHGPMAGAGTGSYSAQHSPSKSPAVIARAKPRDRFAQKENRQPAALHGTPQSSRLPQAPVLPRRRAPDRFGGPTSKISGGPKNRDEPVRVRKLKAVYGGPVRGGAAAGAARGGARVRR